ncbi:MAG: undecaprenyl-diphosphate phosphatase [Alphaproteobacteria bacterium]|nr:undecaprenyl-diphosphate phosphatase [Alphaproteobacteria bacterium]
MTLLHILTVAVVQGITEFLPISSQAHLVLIPHLTGWCDQGPVIDIGVHFGTLLAVIVYFRRDCLSLARGAGAAVRGKRTGETRLALQILIATAPVLAAGYILQKGLGISFRDPGVIAWMTLGFGILLWVGDRWGPKDKGLDRMTGSAAFAIGCAQVLALIPGTSRSGVTMTAARMLGFDRAEAARFSLLMAIPVILAAATLAGIDVVQTGDVSLTWAVAVAVAFAFVAALIAIAAMMRWLRHASFTPFVAYRCLLGIALLTAVYGFGFGQSQSLATCVGG